MSNTRNEVINQDSPEQKEESTEKATHVAEQATKEYTEIEKKAIEIGWDPNHQGKTFVAAEEYVNRAPLFRRIEEQSKELRELKNIQKQTLDHISSVRQDAYDKALQDLENKKLHAVSTGDVERYKAVEVEANSIKTKMANDPITKQTQPQPDPDIMNWVSKNSSWYNTDSVENRKMKAAAELIDTFMTNNARIEQNISKDQIPKLNIKEHFETVEKEVKRLFPHRFENMNREQPSAVGKSTTGSSGNVVSTNLVSRLTPQQRIMGERFYKGDKDYPLEKYAADLEATGRLGK